MLAPKKSFSPLSYSLAAATALSVLGCEGSPPVVVAASPASVCRPASSSHSAGATSVGASLIGATLSYQSDIKPMMDLYCASCHTNNKRPELSSYSATVAGADASLRTMQDGSMPRGGEMPPDQIEKFQSWIAAGTPEQAVQPVTPTPPYPTAPMPQGPYPAFPLPQTPNYPTAPTPILTPQVSPKPAPLPAGPIGQPVSTSPGNCG